MADNLKIFGTSYYDVQGQKFTDLDGNEKTYIRPAGTKQIAQNGTADVKKYEYAEVAVPASAVDEGTKQITQNGDGQDVIGYAAVDVNVPGIVPAGTKQINQNGTHNVAQYASAEVNVPNTYAASDEGKVVHNGALTAQTSGTATENGTVDTTLINSLLVDVSSGGQPITLLASGTYTQATTSPDMYIPVSYSGTPLFAFVVNRNPTSGVAQALGWSVPVPTQEMLDIMNGYFVGNDLSIAIRMLTSGTMSKVIAYTPTEVTATQIHVRRAGGSGYDPTGGETYNWYIWGV